MMLARLARGSFSGHETFTFRYPWLKKGADALRQDPGIFGAEDAIVELGVGKNMVSSIRHWCLTVGVAEESPAPGERRPALRVSDFGKKLLSERGWDPYLEDDATLWLLHWRLVTGGERATTWYAAFHLFREPEFTRATLTDELLRLAAERRWERVSRSTVESDVSCFVRTYVAVKRGVTSTLEDTLDCPLTQLGLILADAKGERFRFNARPKPSLPPAVFAAALADFWNTAHDRQNTLSLREIVHGEGSPGRAFRLDEDAALGYLDALADATAGAMAFDDTALIRQARRLAPADSFAILNRYYRAHE
jgi:hypothetical protein